MTRSTFTTQWTGAVTWTGRAETVGRLILPYWPPGRASTIGQPKREATNG